MKRLPPIALATIAILFSACSPKKELSPPVAASSTEIQVLETAAASSSFQENIQSHLDLLRLADKVSSAIINPQPSNGGKEIVYIFRGMGNDRMVVPAQRRLANKWASSGNNACWIPWTDIPAPTPDTRGIFQGAYTADSFQLTLWIDRFANDLFICYSEPKIPAEKQ